MGTGDVMMILKNAAAVTFITVAPIMVIGLVLGL